MKLGPIRCFVGFFAIAAIVAAGMFGRGVGWQDQERIYQALLQVSAIIFGVMGAWIAILYPKSLGEILRLDGQESEQSRRARQLLNAMKWATGIVAASLLVQLIAPLAKEVQYLESRKVLLRGISMGFLTFLVLIQLWTLLLSLLPVDHSEEDITKTVESVQSKHRRIASTTRLSNGEDDVTPPGPHQS